MRWLATAADDFRAITGTVVRRAVQNRMKGKAFGVPPIRIWLAQLVTVGVAAMIAPGCERLQRPQANACPASLAGVPAPDAAGIVEALGKQERLTGSIVSVRVECLPSRRERREADRRERGVADYELAVTATVEYKISDQDFFSSDANLIFEALSANGVVLGSAKAFFRFTKNGSSGQVSSKIAGLSDEEVRRVSSVQARWEDGS